MTCEICGRPHWPKDGLPEGATDAEREQYCASGTPGDGTYFDATGECLRLGYDRQRERADAAEDRLAEAHRERDMERMSWQALTEKAEQALAAERTRADAAERERNLAWKAVDDLLVKWDTAMGEFHSYRALSDNLGIRVNAINKDLAAERERSRVLTEAMEQEAARYDAMDMPGFARRVRAALASTQKPSAKEESSSG